MISNKSIPAKDFVSKYIQPGVTEAKITSIKSVKSLSNSYGIEITFETAPVQGLNGAGQTATERMWLTEKSAPITVNKLRKIAEAVGVRAQFDEFQSDAATYGDNINPIFAGKSARFLFQGKEVSGKNGTFIKAELYTGYSFVEPVSITPTKLVFNPEVHIKPLEKTTTTGGAIVNKANIAELY